jgi:hypothetical protein
LEEGFVVIAFIVLRVYQGYRIKPHRHLQQLYPAVYKNNRIKSGYLNLTPVNEATHFVASLICY